MKEKVVIVFPFMLCLFRGILGNADCKKMNEDIELCISNLFPKDFGKDEKISSVYRCQMVKCAMDAEKQCPSVFEEIEHKYFYDLDHYLCPSYLSDNEDTACLIARIKVMGCFRRFRVQSVRIDELDSSQKCQAHNCTLMLKDSCPQRRQMLMRYVGDEDPEDCFLTKPKKNEVPGDPCPKIRNEVEKCIYSIIPANFEKLSTTTECQLYKCALRAERWCRRDYWEFEKKFYRTLDPSYCPGPKVIIDDRDTSCDQSIRAQRNCLWENGLLGIPEAKMNFIQRCLAYECLQTLEKNCSDRFVWEKQMFYRDFNMSQCPPTSGNPSCRAVENEFYDCKRRYTDHYANAEKLGFIYSCILYFCAKKAEVVCPKLFVQRMMYYFKELDYTLCSALVATLEDAQCSDSLQKTDDCLTQYHLVNIDIKDMNFTQKCQTYKCWGVSLWNECPRRYFWKRWQMYGTNLNSCPRIENSNTAVSKPDLSCKQVKEEVEECIFRFVPPDFKNLQYGFLFSCRLNYCLGKTKICPDDYKLFKQKGLLAESEDKFFCGQMTQKLENTYCSLVSLKNYDCLRPFFYRRIEMIYWTDTDQCLAYNCWKRVGEACSRPFTSVIKWFKQMDPSNCPIETSKFAGRVPYCDVNLVVEVDNCISSKSQHRPEAEWSSEDKCAVYDCASQLEMTCKEDFEIYRKRYFPTFNSSFCDSSLKRRESQTCNKFRERAVKCLRLAKIEHMKVEDMNFQQKCQLYKCALKFRKACNLRFEILREKLEKTDLDNCPTKTPANVENLSCGQVKQEIDECILKNIPTTATEDQLGFHRECLYQYCSQKAQHLCPKDYDFYRITYFTNLDESRCPYIVISNKIKAVAPRSNEIHILKMKTKEGESNKPDRNKEEADENKELVVTEGIILDEESLAVCAPSSVDVWSCIDNLRDTGEYEDWEDFIAKEKCGIYECSLKIKDECPLHFAQIQRSWLDKEDVTPCLTAIVSQSKKVSANQVCPEWNKTYSECMEHIAPFAENVEELSFLEKCQVGNCVVTFKEKCPKDFNKYFGELDSWKCLSKLYGEAKKNCR